MDMSTISSGKPILKDTIPNETIPDHILMHEESSYCVYCKGIKEGVITAKYGDFRKDIVTVIDHYESKWIDYYYLNQSMGQGVDCMGCHAFCGWTDRELYEVFCTNIRALATARKFRPVPPLAFP